MSAGEAIQLSLGSVADERPAEEPVAAAVGGPFPPTAEQATAIGARERDVFMEAGAGTGKTRVLVDRYCDAVDLDGTEPERILAFTFTEKAAAEMRRRVRVELMRRSRASSDPQRRTALARAARAGEAAPITTIHGFCRRLLVGHPAAAGLDPRFRVLDADESARLGAHAFTRALEDCAGEDDVARLAAGYRNRLTGLIRGAYGELRNQGQRRPALPPLQITAFEGAGEEPPDPAEVELADASYAALRTLLARYAELYEQLKAERSGVDFDDLQLLALELLEGSPRIAAAQRERFDHLLVDEFQDTSPLQVRLVRALCGPGCRLFTVGDEFQSIYAFRGADLESFRAERRRIRERDGEGAVLALSGSFRSTPQIVAAVNAIGRCLLEGFRELRVGALPEEAAGSGPEPAVEILLTEREGWKAEGIELRTAAVETEPNRIAEARQLALRLRELADGGVPTGSMVLLLRAFSHVDAYAEALELAGLDPYVVGGRGYWSAQQVTDALRLLACVANPLDDEALLGALASPACGASPDSLWILRRTAGRGRHLWPAIEAHLLGLREAPDAAAEPERAERWRGAAEWADRIEAEERHRIGRFAERLRELRERAALLPLDTLLERTMEAFDYDLAALVLAGGRRRAANLQKLVRMAAEFEAHEGRDLRGFLAYAAERAAISDREAEAAVAAAEHDGVTVMTVHAAKGLEFDCVALGDLGRPMANPGAPPALRLAFGSAEVEHGVEAAPAGPRIGLRIARAGAGSLTLDGYKELNDEAARADAEEAGRLAYVAASRARERLILSGLCDPADLEGGTPEPKPRHSVLARLLPALGVGDEDSQQLTLPAPEARADLQASFAPAPVAVRLNRADPRTAAELAFDLRERDGGGEQAPEPGGRPPLLGLAQRPGNAARSLSYAALSDYRRCGYRFLVERMLGLGSRAAGRGGAPGGGDHERPSGRDERLAFGRAVHGLLEQSAREEWREPAPEAVAAVLAREGIDAGEADRAASRVGAWLRSPLLAELRAQGARFRPELPFRVALGAETVLRGTIDLLVEAPGRPPLVVDYKTDAAPAAGADGLPEDYAIQRALYAHAVSESSGAQVVETAYVFLAEPATPIRAELDAAAIAAGRERIEALIAGIGAREFTATERPHAALCHDCPARARLCPHPPELTLAEVPPEVSPAA